MIPSDWVAWLLGKPSTAETEHSVEYLYYAQSVKYGQHIPELV